MVLPCRNTGGAGGTSKTLVSSLEDEDGAEGVFLINTGRLSPAQPMGNEGKAGALQLTLLFFIHSIVSHLGVGVAIKSAPLYREMGH